MDSSATIFGLGKQANPWSKIFCVPGDNCQEGDILGCHNSVCVCGGVGVGEALLPDLGSKGQGWAKHPMMHDTATTAKNYWIQILAVSILKLLDLDIVP